MPAPGPRRWRSSTPADPGREPGAAEFARYPGAAMALVMGVVNVTPDSLSDGGRWFDRSAAIAHGLELFAEGADGFDVGGESTRPGAAPVPVDEERRRVVPVVEGLAASGRGRVS